ncbi:MAG: hypothetical protein HQK58_01875 [Deltaproteobacteria bacterium]|nr:hypothetical protein [Deltaproteobacteria bacterium]
MAILKKIHPFALPDLKNNLSHGEIIGIFGKVGLDHFERTCRLSMIGGKNMITSGRRIFRILAMLFIILSLAGEVLGMTVKITAVGPSNDDQGNITNLVQPGSTVYFTMKYSGTGAGNADFLIKVSDATGNEIPDLEGKGNTQVKDGIGTWNAMVNLPPDLGPGKYIMAGSISSGGQEPAHSKGEFFVQGGTDYIWIKKMEISATKDGPALSQVSPGASFFMRVNYKITGATSGDKGQITLWTIRPDGQYDAGLTDSRTFDAAEGNWVTSIQFTLPANAVPGSYIFWAAASVSGSVAGCDAGIGQFQVAGGGFKVTEMSRPVPATRRVPSPAAGWSDLRLYGGQVESIAIDPNDGNMVFAGTYGGDGLFESEDGGQTWQAVPGFRNGTVYSISICRSDPNVIWTIEDTTGVYRSTDKGISFISSLPAKGHNWNSIAVHPQRPELALVGTGGFGNAFDMGLIFYTEDAGQSWNQLPQVFDYPVWSIVINPQNDAEIWVGTGRSKDTGKNGSLYKSGDGGRSWTKVVTGLVSDYRLLAVNPVNPNIIFAGGTAGLVRSIDGGRTWNVAKPVSCYSLALDPTNPQVVYVGNSTDDRLLFKSIDGGETWESIPVGLNALALAVDPTRPQLVHLGDLFQGVFISRDAGRTFAPADDGIEANLIMRLAPDLTSSGDLLAASVSGLYRRNADTSWQELTGGSDWFYSVVQHPVNPEIIYTGSFWALLKSIDNGRTWTRTALHRYFDGTLKVVSLAIPKSGGDTVYVATQYYDINVQGMVLRSLDAGTTWDPIFAINQPVNAVVISPDNANLMIAGTGCFYAPGCPGNLFISPDRGRTWISTFTNAVVNNITISPDLPRQIYISCGSSGSNYYGVFASSNLGLTWTKLTPEEVADGFVNLNIDPAAPGLLYLASFKHGIYFSADFGTSWTSLGMEDYKLYDLLAVGGKSNTTGQMVKDDCGATMLYAGGASGVSRKSGGGVGWVIGEVRDTNNQLLDNIIVETSGSMDYTVGGRFRLAVADGQYSIKCYGAGHQTVTFPNRVDVPTCAEVPLNFTLPPSKAAVAFRAVKDVCNQKDTPEVTINYCGQGDAVEYLAVFPPDAGGRFFCLDKQGNSFGDNLPSPRAKVTLTPNFNTQKRRVLK